MAELAPLGDTELHVGHPPDMPHSDLYALTSLSCRGCDSRWRQFRIAGETLKVLRCPGCGRRLVQYYEGEPDTRQRMLLN